MQLLPDGTVVPHYFSMQDSREGEATGTDNDFALRVGEVQRAVYPDDKDAPDGQKFVEYDVMVEYVDEGTGAVTHQLYPRCTIINVFGGLADKFTFTLRGDDSQHRDRNAPSPGLGFGSKVLILCIQGKRHAGIIIGGVRDEQDIKEEKKAGHNLHFVFNGVDCTINDAGELSVAYTGRTTVDGKRDSNVEEAVTGTKVTFLKNGNLVLGTRDGNQQLTLDRANKKVQLDVKNGKLVIKASDGVEVGAATDAWVKGTTYRQAESAMLKQLQAQLTAAATAMQTGKTPLTAPAALTAAATCFQLAAQAIASFEANADNYLSKKNTSD